MFGLGSLISGAISTIGGAIGAVKSIFGGSSKGGDNSSLSHNSTTTSNIQTMHEPDKVRVAELENARMDRAVEAQKEIMQMNADIQIVIMEAHQKGFEHSTEVLKEMMLSLNNIAQERLMLIENGHFEVVEKIEKLYMGLEKEIREDNTSFNMDKLPKMLELLQQFPVESSSAELYKKSIDNEIQMNMIFFTKKLTALHERQKLMVESAIDSKKQVSEQSAQIVLERMRFLDRQLENQQNMRIAQSQPQKINLTATDSKDVEVKLIEE